MIFGIVIEGTENSRRDRIILVLYQEVLRPASSLFIIELSKVPTPHTWNVIASNHGISLDN